MKRFFVLTIACFLALLSSAQFKAPQGVKFGSSTTIDENEAGVIDNSSASLISSGALPLTFEVPVVLTDGPTIYLDGSQSRTGSVTLTASRTFAIMNPIAGITYELKLTQGGSGSYTLNYPSNTYWPASKPTLSTAVGATDRIFLKYDGTNFYGDSRLAQTADASAPKTYYVSNAGNDSNSGLTPALAWASLNKVNTTTLSPGDRVLFRCGDSWSGQLVPQSGSASGAVTYSSYGTGNKPLITQSVILNSTSNWVNVSGNIWRNADYTISSTELLTNVTDAASFSDIQAVAAANKSVDATIFYAGTNSLKMSCTSTQSTESAMYFRTNAAIAMVAGTSYELTFYAKASAASTLNNVFVTDGSGIEIGATTITATAITTNWTQYKMTFTPTKSTTAGRIYFQFGLGLANGQSLWFDNFTFRQITSYYAGTEVGNIILNNTTAGVRKWDQASCTSQGNFFWDKTAKSLRMYSVGNPATFYSDIKVCQANVIVNNASKSYITLDGLAVKYGGTSGIGYGENSYFQIIRNCEVAWCGGRQWGVTTTRLGNGIDFYDATGNNLVENCKIWEIYDAGVSNQSPATLCSQTNITYRNNQIWNCEYLYEYFSNNSSSTVSNIQFINNTLYNAGGGWSHAQRPDPSGYCIRMGGSEATTTGFVVKNNIIYNATTALIRHYSIEPFNRFTVDYNLYFNQNGSVALYDVSQTFAAHKIATSWDANSINSDPKLVNTTTKDLSLQQASPAIDVADPSMTDSDGSRKDIGAINYDKNPKYYLIKK